MPLEFSENAASRQCIEDIGGTMLCKDCLSRLRVARELQSREEAQQEQMALEDVQRIAKRRLCWSYGFAIFGDVFYISACRRLVVSSERKWRTPSTQTADQYTFLRL